MRAVLRGGGGRMRAVFRDNIGTFELDKVANIQYYKDNIWSVMYEDYETEEIKGELVEIDNQD